MILKKKVKNNFNFLVKSDLDEDEETNENISSDTDEKIYKK